MDFGIFASFVRTNFWKKKSVFVCVRKWDVLFSVLICECFSIRYIWFF